MKNMNLPRHYINDIFVVWGKLGRAKKSPPPPPVSPPLHNCPHSWLDNPILNAAPKNNVFNIITIVLAAGPTKETKRNL